MEAINFEDIAELTVARQDELAAKWAKHIADSVQQAAEAGQDCVYLSQVTDKGYVPNMKRLFIEHLRIGNVSKAFVAVKDDFDAVCQLIRIETLDQQRVEIIEGAADLCGCRLEIQREDIRWDKRVSSIRGEEVLPF